MGKSVKVKKIVFKGKRYWLNGHNISPLNHFDKNGVLNIINALDDGFISYAVIVGDGIFRFHQLIGSVKKDIKEVKASDD